MNSKIKSWIVLGLVIVGGLSFYAGTKYNKNPVASNDQSNQNQGMSGGRRGGMRMGANGGFVGGSIVSMDDKSITVSMRDGSSKIILFSTTTPVMKMVAGTKSDLAVGKEVTISGTPNPDGSIVAESISLRPEQDQNQKTN